jgi:hypothetical protein
VKVSGYAGGGARRGKLIAADKFRTRVERDAVYPALQFFIKPTGLAN